MSLFSRFFGKQPPKEGASSDDANKDAQSQPAIPVAQPVPQAPAHQTTQRVIPPGVLSAPGMLPPPPDDDPGIVLPEPAVEVPTRGKTQPPVDPRFAHWSGGAQPEYGETIPPVRQYTLQTPAAMSPMSPPQAEMPAATPVAATHAAAPAPAPSQPRKDRPSPTNFTPVQTQGGPAPHPRLRPNDALPSIIVDIPEDSRPPTRQVTTQLGTQQLTPQQLAAHQITTQQIVNAPPHPAPQQQAPAHAPPVIARTQTLLMPLGPAAPGQSSQGAPAPPPLPPPPPPSAPKIAAHAPPLPPPLQLKDAPSAPSIAANKTAPLGSSAPTHTAPAHAASPAPPQAAAAAPPPAASSERSLASKPPLPLPSQTSHGSSPSVSQQAQDTASKAAPAKLYRGTLVGINPPLIAGPATIPDDTEASVKPAAAPREAPARHAAALPAPAPPAPLPSPPAPPVRASVPPNPRYPSAPPPARTADPAAHPIPKDLIAANESDDDDEPSGSGGDDDAPTIVRSDPTSSVSPEILAARAELEKRESLQNTSSESNETPPDSVTPPPFSPTPVSRVDELSGARPAAKTEMNLAELVAGALAQVAAAEAAPEAAPDEPRATRGDDGPHTPAPAAVMHSLPPEPPDESDWPTATELPDPDAWMQPSATARGESLEDAPTNERLDELAPLATPSAPEAVAPPQRREAPRAEVQSSAPHTAASEPAPPAESSPVPMASSKAPATLANVVFDVRAESSDEPPVTDRAERGPMSLAAVPPEPSPSRPKLWDNVDDADVLAEVDAGFSDIEAIQSQPPMRSAVFDDARQLFADIAATQMHHVRDFMMDLSLAPTTADWLALCIPATESLRQGAEQFEMDGLTRALEGFLAALKTASDGGAPIVEGDARDQLLAAYNNLARELPAAFKFDRDGVAREGIIVRALLNQLDDVRKVQQDRLFQAGLMSLDALCIAKPRDIVETTGLALDLATRISERFRRYKLEVMLNSVGAPHADWQKLREYTNVLRVSHDAFEDASRKSDSKKKKESRRARELALLDVKVMLARLGQPESLGFIERAAFADKLTHLEDLIAKSEPASS